jgi:hypothetical protein
MWTVAHRSSDLWAITAAGALSDAAEKNSREIADPIVVQQDAVMIALGQITGHTGLDRTTLQLAEQWASPAPFHSPTIIWICPKNSLLDCILYWNRRALRSLSFAWSPMIVLPESEIRNWPHIGTQVRELLAGRPDEFEPDVLFLSHSIPHERLRGIGTLLGMVESSKDVRIESKSPPPPARQPPFTFLVDRDPTPSLLFQRRYGATAISSAQVFRERTAVSLELPVHFNGPGFFKVNIASEVFEAFPKRDVVANIVANNTRWHDGGLEFLYQTWPRYKFDIRIPMLVEVATVTLQSSVASWVLSDKGRLGESIISAKNLEVLLQAGVYEAIRDLTTRRSNHLVREIEAREHTDEELDRARFVSEIGGRFERRSQSATELQMVSGASRADALERLVSLNWAERGLRIVCTRCDVTSFIKLQGADGSAMCPGCGTTQAYVHSTQGVTLYYRLNSLIDRASDQGVLPHLLAIAALRKRSENTFIFPGIDVQLDSGERGELDLFGVHLGKVVAGEVKTAAKDFSPEQINRDVRITEAVGADVHVMACIEEPSEETIDRATALVERRGRELIVFGAADLRP